MIQDAPIYLDYNATTPLDPDVLKAMMPYLTHEFGNAASVQHAFGHRARDAVEKAREGVSSLLGADPREVVWTSGATESNNLALKGLFGSPAYQKVNRRLITCRTEHKAVLDPSDHLKTCGVDVVCLPVDQQGRLDLESLREALSKETLLVSMMHGNNETGALHPIREIAELCHEHGALFHTDATQTFGKIPIDVEDLGVDLLSLSAHKIYGPKGVGALYVRRRGPRVRVSPLIDGGGHERGLRSGTLNVPSIVGLGEAALIARRVMDHDGERILRFRNQFEKGLRSGEFGATIHAQGTERLMTTSNVSFSGVDAESLISEMSTLAVSSSSACTSAQRQPSFVLRAMGLSEDDIRGSIRFSFGRMSEESDVDRAQSILRNAIDDQREKGAPESSSCTL